jgi:hypothetical protein
MMHNTCTCAYCINNQKKPNKNKNKNKKIKREWSKQLIADIRSLLWIVTLGGLFLAAMCIYKGYLGSLPWVSAMVGLPWTAHGTICSFYLNMAKSDHREGGITFEQAKANNFNQADIEVTFTQASQDSPSI